MTANRELDRQALEGTPVSRTLPIPTLPLPTLVEPSRTGRLIGLLGLVAAALYEYLFLEFPLGRLDQRASFVSELSARDQPWHRLFESFDKTSGVLIVVLAYGLWLAVPAGRAVTAGCWSLAGFGLSTLGVGLLPMDCAISASRTCELNDELGRVSWMHQGHTVVSVTASISSIAALLLLGRALRTRSGWAVAARGSVVVLPVVVLMDGVLAVLGLGWGRGETGTFAGGLYSFLGTFERIEILALTLWLAALAANLVYVSRGGVCLGRDENRTDDAVQVSGSAVQAPTGADR